MRILSLSLALLSSLAGMQAADLTGFWAAHSVRTDGSAYDTFFDLHQDGANVTGTVYASMRDVKITDGKIEGNHVSFKTGRLTYEGALENDQLHLTANRPNGQNGNEITAARSQPGAEKPPAPLPTPALHPVRDNGLVRTPPMGWNSWNKFAGRVDDAGVRAVTDAMVKSGMKAAGYIYVNIDDTWQAGRDAKGNIQANKKFPNMKALADYVHSKGLKIGIYSSPGPLTCAGYEGSFGHEEQDARTYAAWGIDYLKYDWCSAGRVYKDTDMQAVYQKMGDALQKTGRKIVYSLCQYGKQDVWKWGPEVGGNLWRTTGDIADNWASMSKIGFDQNDLGQYAKPGHWNDPDMLEVGNGGMKPDEYRTHLALWAILAAPLLAGNDIAAMTDETKAMLTNPGMIAVDQDPLGKQGHLVTRDGNIQVWTRHLKGGALAVGIFNLSESAGSNTSTWISLGLDGAPKRITDIWTQKPVQVPGTKEITTKVPGHGVAFWRVEP